MTEAFLFSQKPFENTTRFIFFTLKKKNHFILLLGQTRAKKIPFKIGYKIPWTYVLLILKFFDPHQKSYGFRRLFLNGVFVRRPEKTCFKSAEISAASSMGVGSFY